MDGNCNIITEILLVISYTTSYCKKWYYSTSSNTITSGGGWGETPYMIVKRFGCNTQSSAILMLHSFILVTSYCPTLVSPQLDLVCVSSEAPVVEKLCLSELDQCEENEPEMSRFEELRRRMIQMERAELESAGDGGTRSCCRAGSHHQTWVHQLLLY